jgi:molybdate transport system substrate-binding protein
VLVLGFVRDVVLVRVRVFVVDIVRVLVLVLGLGLGLGLVLGLVLVLGLGLGPRTARAAPAPELTVFAASSLREAFTAIAEQFEAEHAGTRVALQFAGSQELRVQIENGAAADVFASADERQMARVRELMLEPAVFARNQPVVVVPRDNPAGLRAFADLPRAHRIVLGAQEVPIGAYAERILAAAHLSLEGRVVSRELNVRQVLAKVELGEADAAIVYRTDAARAAVQVIEIPKAFNLIAEYPIAALSRARQPRLAEQFVQLVRSPAGRSVLARFGFAP